MSEETPSPNKAAFKRRWWLWAAAPALFAGAVWFTVPRALAFAPWHGCRDRAQSADDLRDRMEHRVEFVLDRLDATDAQRSQIQAIVAKSAPEMFAISEQGHKLRTEVKESLAAAAIDKTRLEKAHQELDVLANRATDLGTRTLLAVAEALTPEQRKQVAEHLARLHGDH